jgi:hypothetical protein
MSWPPTAIAPVRLTVPQMMLISGLARAIGAEQREDFAALNRQVDAIKRLVAGLVLLADW